MTQTVFIAGGNRGIGYSLVKAYSSDHKVITSARDPDAATELNKLAENADIHVVKLDLNDEDSIKAAAVATKKITDKIDIFICNSGIADVTGSFFATPKENWTKHFQTNVLGPILLFQQFQPLMKTSDVKKVSFVSSMAGSLTYDLPFPGTAYGQSKAALNFTVINLAKELKNDGFIVIPIHPGVVTTDMNKQVSAKMMEQNPELGAVFLQLPPPITPEQCGDDIKKLMAGLKPEDSGKFWGHDGQQLPY